MHRVQAGPLAGFVGLLALLATLSATVGLGGVGWAVGVLSGAVLSATARRCPGPATARPGSGRPAA